MKKPTRPLLISYAIFGIALIAFVASAIVGASDAAQQIETVNKAPDTPAAVETAETKPSEQPAPTSEPAATDQSTTAPVTVKNQAVAPQSTTGAVVPEKTEPLDGGHIPFTNKPVTPGDPASYIDTVGQCPFYEMGGDKGCVPPPDIECNADWSVCTYKGE